MEQISLKNWKKKFKTSLKEQYHMPHQPCLGRASIPDNALSFKEWVQYAYSVRNENADIIKLQA